MELPILLIFGAWFVWALAFRLWILAAVLWLAVAALVEWRTAVLVRLGVVPHEPCTWAEHVFGFVTAPWDFAVGFVRGFVRGRRSARRTP